jgi:hypothetical protein
VAEALELTLDDDWETVVEADDELLTIELEEVADVEPLADEELETASLAPHT